jgi:hypothetical protein
VVNTWLFLVGMTVLRGMSLVITPPTVTAGKHRGGGRGTAGGGSISEVEKVTVLLTSKL